MIKGSTNINEVLPSVLFFVMLFFDAVQLLKMIR